jgi:hypothetical protein
MGVKLEVVSMKKWSPRTDTELWERAKAGHLSTFGILYRRHAEQLRRHVAESYGAGAPIEEIVCASFLEIWREKPRLAGAEGSFWQDLVASTTLVVERDGHVILESRKARSSGQVPSEQPDLGDMPGPDPKEVALLYLGAGLGAATVAAVLRTTRVGVIRALQTYGAGDRVTGDARAAEVE